MNSHHPSPGSISEETDSVLFQQLEDYAWDSDLEFQRGLQAILGSNYSTDSIAKPEHLILRARCFYFARYDILDVSRHVFNKRVTERSFRTGKTALLSISAPTKHGALSILTPSQMAFQCYTQK